MGKRGKDISKSLAENGFTPFQIRVYKAVAKIPFGQVKSYKWVAQRINNPYSYRAVGQALKRNPYLGTIPCHRVIKSDGSIGGFAGGRLAKMRLIRSEGIDIIRLKGRKKYYGRFKRCLK